MTNTVLEVNNLETVFGREGRGPVAQAVRGVSFGVGAGRTLGIVGESGIGEKRHGALGAAADCRAGADCRAARCA